MTGFELTTTSNADQTVVSVAGECDLSTREQFSSTLLAAVDEAPVVLVDLLDLRFIDSTGLHAIVLAHQAAQRQGRHLYLVNAGGAVARVLELTGVGALLQPPLEPPQAAGRR